MNDRRRDELERELLDYEFGCHDDPTGLEQRLAADPDLRALHEQVRNTAALLRVAAHETIDELDVGAASAGTRRAPGRIRRFAFRVQLIAAAAIVALLPYGGLLIWREHELASLGDQVARLQLTGPRTVADGAPLSCSVEVDSPDGTAIDVEWAALGADDAPLARGTLTVADRTTFVVPPTLPAPRRIVVRAPAVAGAEAGLELAVDPATHAPFVHLITDRPLYRPGETVFVRAVHLDRISLEPLQNRTVCTLRIFDPLDAEVAAAGYIPMVDELPGVHGWSFRLDANAVGGRYRAEVTAAVGGVTDSVDFVVRRSELMRFRKELTLDRASYRAGDHGVAELHVARIGGGTVAGAKVDAMLAVDGKVDSTREAMLDADGRALLEFEVPADPGRGELQLIARVFDGSLVETVREAVIVPTTDLEVGAWPEGGALVAGFENRVYFEIRDPLGRAVDATGRVVATDGVEVAQWTTAHDGRGTVAFTPQSGRGYRLELDTPHPATAALPTVDDHGVVLQSLAERHPAGAPLRLRVAQIDDRSLIVAAFCRGQLVGQTTVPAAGMHDLALDIGPTAAGVLRVTVFAADDLRPLAERLVQRAPRDSLRLDVRSADPVTVPGAAQRVEIAALRSDGSPAVGAVLGVRVTDARTWHQLDTAPIGIVDQLALFGDVDDIEDAAPLLLAAEQSAARVDLLLGTRGWRRFVWLGDESADTRLAVGAGNEPDPMRTAIAAKHGLVTTPQVLDSESVVVQRRALAHGDVRHARQGLGATVALTILGLLLWLFGEAGAKVMRAIRPHAHPLLQLGAGSFTAVVGVFLVASASMFWMPGTLGSAAPIARFVERLGTDNETWKTEEAIAEGMQGDTGAIFVDAIDRDSIEDFVVFDADDQPQADPLRASRLSQTPAETANDDFDARNGLIARIDSSLRGWVREYVHVNRGDRSTRDDFSETAYWSAWTVTDADGRAVCAFELPDQVTTWRVDVDGHGDGGIAQAQASFDARLPLQLEAVLPIEVAAGDTLEVPVAVVVDGVDPTNAGPAGIRVRVRGDAVTTTAERHELTLTDGRGRVLVPLTVVGEGSAQIAMQGAVGPWRDSMTRELRVVPRGFPHRRSWSGVLRDEFAFQLAAPTDAIGSPTAMLKLYPSTLAQFQASLEGMLQDPHGCFEQASSSNYPNTMILTWMQETGTVRPELAARTRHLLDEGYRLLTSYECRRYGYEWFGHDPGHDSLTAYGLLEFHDMAAVYPVDDEMVDRTRSWLLALRDGDGGYERRGTPHGFGSAPREVIEAYNTYALAYAGTPVAELGAELDRAAVRAATTEDPYELALVALALQAAQRDGVGPARTRLAAMQRAGGQLEGAATSITGSLGQDLLVETTAFAALAWMDDANHHDDADRAIAWLLHQRNGRGTFGATQATICALRALTAHARVRQATEPSGVVRVFVDQREVAAHEFDRDAYEPFGFDLGPTLQRGATHEVRIVLDGEGALPWSCELAYHSDLPADDADSPLAIATALATEQVDEGAMVRLTATIENRTTDGLPMAMAILGLPAGLEVTTAELDAARDRGAFDHWGIRGRDIELYWRGVAPSGHLEVGLDCVARIPGTTTGPASRAYLYYSPEATRWATPLTIRVRPR